MHPHIFHTSQYKSVKLRCCSITEGKPEVCHQAVVKYCTCRLYNTNCICAVAVNKKLKQYDKKYWPCVIVYPSSNSSLSISNYIMIYLHVASVSIICTSLMSMSVNYSGNDKHTYTSFIGSIITQLS